MRRPWPAAPGRESMSRAAASRSNGSATRPAWPSGSSTRDPDNRLVAAELERRWEAALRELQQAEEAWRGTKRNAAAQGAQPGGAGAFREAGRRIPELWRDRALARQQKGAAALPDRQGGRPPLRPRHASRSASSGGVGRRTSGGLGSRWASGTPRRAGGNGGKNSGDRGKGGGMKRSPTN